MSFKFILILSYLGYVSTQCGKGCLQCTQTLGKQTECAVCDQLSLYYRDRIGCVQVNDPNCVEIDERGFCTRCKDKHYPGVAFAGVNTTNNVADVNTGLASDTNEVPRVTCQPVPKI